MDLQKLKSYLSVQLEPSFRFRQIVSHYYSGRTKSFDLMTDLSKPLREKLTADISYLSVKPQKILKSNSALQSQKALLELKDGLTIESVLMDYGEWVTACVSSQVGCPLGCTFCATGKMGLKRNLTVEEIVDQIIYWNQELYPKYVGRIVFMGMGEPFLNWDNLLSALKVVNQDLKIGARKISISTAGIADRIREFANLNTEINLAISLHSADQNVRQSIMPVAKMHPLPELVNALNYYVGRTHRQIFLEYALIDGQNDSPDQIRKLITLIKSNRLFYLNIIPLNPISGGLVPSTHLKEVTNLLDQTHTLYSLRQSFGREINSACGQLTTSPVPTSPLPNLGQN